MIYGSGFLTNRAFLWHWSTTLVFKYCGILIKLILFLVLLYKKVLDVIRFVKSSLFKNVDNGNNTSHLEPMSTIGEFSYSPYVDQDFQWNIKRALRFSFASLADIFKRRSFYGEVTWICPPLLFKTYTTRRVFSF